MQVTISLLITSSFMIRSMVIGFVYPKVYAFIKTASESTKSKNYLVSLFLTNMGINVTLFVFHVFSIVNLIPGNEILYNTDFADSDDYQSLPIVHAIFSVLVIVIVFTIATVWFIIRLVGRNWQTSIAMTLALNFILWLSLHHIGFYSRSNTNLFYTLYGGVMLLLWIPVLVWVMQLLCFIRCMD